MKRLQKVFDGDHFSVPFSVNPTALFQDVGECHPESEDHSPILAWIQEAMGQKIARQAGAETVVGAGVIALLCWQSRS